MLRKSRFPCAALAFVVPANRDSSG